MDQDSVKLGLLMETAQTHQKLAEAAVEKLGAYTQGLETVVRDHIRCALVDEMQVVHAEIRSAVEALQRVNRAAIARGTFLMLGLTAIVAATALSVAQWVLPTPAEIAARRTKRDELASNVETLNQHGARADLRRCEKRLCVRVDLKAARYGDQRDYFVIRGC